MRLIITFMALIFQFSAFAQTVLISGKITNAAADKITVSYNKGAALYGFNKVEKEAALDKKGRFKVELPLDAPAEVTFIHGNEATYLYLEPGDDVSVTLNTEQFDETVKYEGKAAANNNFMAQYFLRFLENSQEKAKIKYTRLANVPAQDYLLYLDSIAAAKNTFFRQHESKLSPNFKKYFSNRMSYEIANEKLDYPDLKRYYTQKDAELPADFYSFLEEVKVQNDSAVMMGTYLQFLDNFLFYEVQRLRKDAQVQNYKFYNAKYAVADLYLTGKAREVIMADVLKSAIGYLPFKESEILYTGFRQTVNDKDLQDYVTKKYEKKKLLAEGAAAPLFALKDTSGKTVSLQDFKGKIVYMDFWASWCGPCMKEAPHAVKLQEQFKNKDVVFLYVSTDENEEAWRNAIRTKNLQKGVHLISKESAENVQEKYDVEGIPSYFLIGRDGKIINGNASRPSDEKTVELLNDALTQQ